MVNIETVKHVITISFLCILCQSIKAQDFSGHAPGLHWQHLDTKVANIFFPTGHEATARKVYQKILGFYLQDTSLGHKRFKINMVLQNQTVESNGYVGIGPWQSEFYITPPHLPYLLGSIDWVEALSIHEYRHVLQGMNSRVGINNILYHLLGEESWGASYGFVVPDWFTEGDAVNSETIYSNGGRGKMPSFVAEFRALHQDQKQWSYAKIRNGSFKDLVPNHYVSGYNMVKYVNDHFGHDTWAKIFDDAVRYKGLWYPFKTALVRHTQLKPADLYTQTVKELNADPDNVEMKDSILIKNNKKNSVIDFTTPNRLFQGGLVYLEIGFDKLPTLHLQDKGNIRNLTTLGITTDPDYGFSEPLAIWTQITPDARWSNRNYSDLVIYNIETNQKKKLTHHQKYFNPTPSNFNTMIACMEYQDDGQCNIVVLDTAGHHLQSIAMENNMLGTYPTFEAADTSLLSIVRGEGYAHIRRFSLHQSGSVALTAPVAAVMSNLSINSDTIYFSSDIDGRDQLYAIIQSNVYQLTHNSIGIQQYSVLGDELLYNYQTSTGIDIRRKRLTDCDYRPVDYFKIPSSAPALRANKAQNSVNSEFAIASSPASLLNNPFRIYSWSVRPDEGGNVFRIIGRNVLNTLEGSLFYGFNSEDRSHSIGSNVQLGIAYPIFTAGITSTFGRSIGSVSMAGKDSIRWNETGWRLGMTLPLKYYITNQVIRIQPIFQLGSYMPAYRQGERKNYQNTQYLRSVLVLSNQRVLARQHVSSRFSQSLVIQWNRALNHKASAWDLNSEMHLPGIGRNDVIEIKFDMHRQLLNDPYRYSNPLEFIRGYRAFSSDLAYRYKASYHLPLWYPDRGINGIYFLQRVRGRAFWEQMDHSIYREPKNLNITYRNIGFEAILDGKIYNVLPASTGFRFNFPLDRDLITRKKSLNFEFFIDQLF